jgi:hypothetical protein
MILPKASGPPVPSKLLAAPGLKGMGSTVPWCHHTPEQHGMRGFA